MTSMQKVYKELDIKVELPLTSKVKFRLYGDCGLGCNMSDKLQ